MFPSNSSVESIGRIRNRNRFGKKNFCGPIFFCFIENMVDLIFETWSLDRHLTGSEGVRENWHIMPQLLTNLQHFALKLFDCGSDCFCGRNFLHKIQPFQQKISTKFGKFNATFTRQILSKVTQY